MYAGVLAHFRVKGCREGIALPDQNRVVPFPGHNLDPGPQMYHLGGANEDHLDLASLHLALPDGALQLPSVSVAAYADVKRTEAGLRRILHFARQQDAAGAGPEGRSRHYEFAQLAETVGPQQLQKGARLAPGDDQAIQAIQLFRFPHEDYLGAQLFEPLAVRVKVALQC